MRVRDPFVIILFAQKRSPPVNRGEKGGRDETDGARGQSCVTSHKRKKATRWGDHVDMQHHA